MHISNGQTEFLQQQNCWEGLIHNENGGAPMLDNFSNAVMCKLLAKISSKHFRAQLLTNFIDVK